MQYRSDPDGNVYLNAPFRPLLISPKDINMSSQFTPVVTEMQVLSDGGS